MLEDWPPRRPRGLASKGLQRPEVSRGPPAAGRANRGRHLPTQWYGPPYPPDGGGWFRPHEPARQTSSGLGRARGGGVARAEATPSAA